MIDLYAAATSNGMRARMALEECGLAYTLHRIALEMREHKTPQFRALNPNAQIPVIVDRDGPGGKPLTLAQSTAILIYCAEKSGRYMPQTGAARAAMWQALMSASSDITPTFAALFVLVNSKQPHAPSIELFNKRLRHYFKVWDQRLADQRYAAGEEVTIADFSLYAGYVRVKGAAPELCGEMPNIDRWAQEMNARPAMQRALQF